MIVLETLGTLEIVVQSTMNSLGICKKTELTVVCYTFEMMKKLSIETKLGIGGELINDKYKYYGMDCC